MTGTVGRAVLQGHSASDLIPTVGVTAWTGYGLLGFTGWLNSPLHVCPLLT